MSAEKRRASGFTLIAVLLLMVLMSALAMGLMYMVNTEARVGGSDMWYQPRPPLTREQGARRPRDQRSIHAMSRSVRCLR